MKVVDLAQAEVLIVALQTEVRDINARLVKVEKTSHLGATVSDHSVELDRHTDLLHEIRRQTDRIGAPADSDKTVWSRLDDHDRILNEHSVILNEHSAMLKEILAIVKQN
ncbi:hypothetical protein [Streptosporangium sp. KLBMP 9127]|nr:hypothetical protein [Streptosporangium sp. KLBMP 9127]